MCTLLAVAATAAADPKPAEPKRTFNVPKERQLATEKPKPIDLKDALDVLDVFRDDTGKYYALPRAGQLDTKSVSDLAFYGDGKTFYQQRTIGWSTNKDGYEWTLWAPRVHDLVGAMLKSTSSALEIECARTTKHSATLLKADEVKTLLKDAKFYPPLWPRQATMLARDDDANYYYVDELRDDFGGNGYRVFVGPKGSMKELPLVNEASDSVGSIFATKGGELKLVKGKDAATWIKGGARVELTVVPVQDNRYLIYRELGIYGALGTVCEDQ